jgi:hypothetical protein
LLGNFVTGFLPAGFLDAGGGVFNIFRKPSLKPIPFAFMTFGLGTKSF